MLISELNEFTGNLSSSLYLAVDNGTDTAKIPVTSLGVQYGTSSTSASTSTKVVSCSGFKLRTGAVIAVKFTYAQTSTGSIYLNVNSTGAKQVYGIPRATTSTSRLDGAWEANEVKLFVYDGSYWRIVDQNIITNDQLTSLQNLVGVYGLYNVLNEIANREPKTTTLTPTITASTGTLVGSSIRRYGNVVWLSLRVRNTASVAVGSMIFTGTLSGVPLPASFCTTATNYGARSLVAYMDYQGNINVRNTHSAAVAMGSMDNLAFSFTWIVDE